MSVLGHERFAIAVIVVLALYGAWMLFGRLTDTRCRLADHRSGGIVCDDRAPIILPRDARDLRAV